MCKACGPLLPSSGEVARSRAAPCSLLYFLSSAVLSRPAMCSHRCLIFASFAPLSAKHERSHRCKRTTNIRRRRMAMAALFVFETSRRNSWIRSAAARFFRKRRLKEKTNLQCA